MLFLTVVSSLSFVAVGVIVKEENVNSHDSCIFYYHEIEFPTNEINFY